MKFQWPWHDLLSTPLQKQKRKAWTPTCLGPDDMTKAMGKPRGPHLNHVSVSILRRQMQGRWQLRSWQLPWAPQEFHHTVLQGWAAGGCLGQHPKLVICGKQPSGVHDCDHTHHGISGTDQCPWLSVITPNGSQEWTPVVHAWYWPTIWTSFHASRNPTIPLLKNHLHQTLPPFHWPSFSTFCHYPGEALYESMWIIIDQSH